MPKITLISLSYASPCTLIEFIITIGSNDRGEKMKIGFARQSTTNQKFLNYEETIVGILDNKYKNYKFANSGIDGMSIIGHINSCLLYTSPSPRD